MDLLNYCRNAAFVLALHTALLPAAEPAARAQPEISDEEWSLADGTDSADSAETVRFLDEEETDFIVQDVCRERGTAFVVYDTTDGESLTPTEVSSEEYCVDDDASAKDSWESNGAGAKVRFDEWMSSMGNRDPFWYSGVEFSFVDIDARSGGRISLSQSDTTAPGVAAVSFRDGDGLTDRGYAPRLWVGHRFGEKWAVQARYWNLNRNVAHLPDQLVPSTGTNFATYTETDRMDASTFDVEAVRSFQPGNWKIDAFVGGRHATLGVESQLHAFGVFTTGNFTNLFLSNGFNFDGTGVTYGLTARHPIGQTNAHLYVSARGGAMSGETDSFGRSAGVIVDNPGTPLSGAATVRRNNAKADLYTAEIQIGVEWTYALSCIPANAFLRAGYEYQDWDINGRPTGGAGFGGTIGELTTNSFSSAGLGDMQLHGLTFATGLTW